MHARYVQTVVLSKIFTLGFLRLMAAALVLLPVAWASAQEADGEFEGETEYTDKDGNQREMKEPTSKARKKVTDLFSVGKASNKEEEQAFEDLAHYYVYALTWKKNISNLADRRKDLKNKCLVLAGQRNRTVTDLHQRANELTLSTCRKVAEDAKYPRAIRYNCMLMISELDAEEAQPGVSAAVPLPAAITAMLEIASDTNQHIAMRLGAVIGLRRPVMLGIAPPLQPTLVDTLLGVLETPPGEGKDRIGQVWLRWEVANLLNYAMTEKKIVVDQARAATSLATLIADENTPTWLRAKLAGELGKLSGGSLPAAQLQPAVRSLAGLMLAISQASPFAVETAAATADESAKAGADKKPTDKRATDKKAAEKAKSTEKKSDKKSDGKKDDKAEPAANTPPKEEVSPTVQKLSSEEMMWQLSQIRLALYGKEAPVGKEKGPDEGHGLHVGADEATKTMIDKIVGHIDEIVKSLAGVAEATSGDLDKLANTLQTANQDLEDLLTGPPAEEAEAPQAPAPVAGRARAPQGNAPADASTTAP